jgi:hypothetical protein
MLNLDVSFLINVYMNKIDCCSVMDTVGFRVPTKQVKRLLPPTSVMFEDLALQQGSSPLQTTFANVWTFPLSITSPLRIHLGLLNFTELHHYRVTCTVLLPRITFSSVIMLILGLSRFCYVCTLSVFVCYEHRPLAVDKHLKEEN